MQGMPKPPQLTREQVDAVMPEDLKKIRELTLSLMGTELFKNWLACMKQYYIMKEPVGLANYPEAYCRFREGQNSLLRSIDTFALEEEAYCKMVSEQLLNQQAGNA